MSENFSQFFVVDSDPPALTGPRQGRASCFECSTDIIFGDCLVYSKQERGSLQLLLSWGYLTDGLFFSYTQVRRGSTLPELLFNRCS